MILTNKQEEAVKLCVQRFKNREPYTCIAGYAGTGKSTTVKFIIDALGLHPDFVAYVAYTGKAATVLMQKGCPNATTAHRLLYRSVQKPDGKFKYIPRPTLPGYRLIIVDEVSMLPKEMWDLLLTHKVHVIALGDPEQLPPVSKDSDNHVLDNPHIFLDEIMRQAQESEIIRLSMHVREGKPLSTFDNTKEEVQIIDKNEIVDGMFTWADQILCATNNNRNHLNSYVRNMLGHGPTLEEGDKVIGLTNHWEVMDTNETYALTNGTIGYVSSLSEDNMYFPFWIYKDPVPVYKITMADEVVTFPHLIIDKKLINTNEKTLTAKQEYMIRKAIKEQEPPYEFAYGYAITVWKAQGSSWPKVMLFEEWFPKETEEHRRYLYTGITRAENRLVVVKK